MPYNPSFAHKCKKYLNFLKKDVANQEGTCENKSMPATTYTAAEVKSAIARSISHNEIVRVETPDPRSILEQLDHDFAITDLDHGTEPGGDLDVWGTYRGQDFRLKVLAI